MTNRIKDHLTNPPMARLTDLLDEVYRAIKAGDWEWQRDAWGEVRSYSSGMEAEAEVRVQNRNHGGDAQ